MKRYLTGLLGLFMVLAFVGVFSSEVNAQRRGRNNNNHSWGNKYSKSQVDRLIRNVEQRTDRFVGQLDNSLDRSRLDGSQREDVLMQKARNLEEATDELRREFDRRDSWRDNREEVSRCLNIATDINVAMRNRKFRGNSESNWNTVRAELNALAAAYGLPKVGSRAY